jgi:anti-sigma-K factor RskA
MTCDAFKELAPAYALSALDDEERAACARHLATGAPHRGCREAVAEAELVAARLGAALMPDRPSPHVWRNIALGLDQVPRSSPLPDDAVRRRGLYHLCGWLVAATVVGLYLYNTPVDLRRRLAAAGRGLESRALTAGPATPH